MSWGPSEDKTWGEVTWNIIYCTYIFIFYKDKAADIMFRADSDSKIKKLTDCTTMMEEDIDNLRKQIARLEVTQQKARNNLIQAVQGRRRDAQKTVMSPAELRACLGLEDLALLSIVEQDRIQFKSLMKHLQDALGFKGKLIESVNEYNSVLSHYKVTQKLGVEDPATKKESDKINAKVTDLIAKAIAALDSNRKMIRQNKTAYDTGGVGSEESRMQILFEMMHGMSSPVATSTMPSNGGGGADRRGREALLV